MCWRLIARCSSSRSSIPIRPRSQQLRFFAGLTIEETAVVVGSSPATVKREWAVAKAWLYRSLTSERAES